VRGITNAVYGLSRSEVGKGLSGLVGAFIDLLFPLTCAVCEQQGRFVCEGCEGGLARLVKPYCSLCAAPGPVSPCAWCKETGPAFDGVTAPYLMEGPVKEMVYDLKYRDLRAAAPDLGRLMAAHLKSSRLPADLLIPVPLHRRRERERGYNQSTLLAREISVLTGIPVEAETLYRTRNTAPQVSMTGREERLKNIEGAFEARADLGGRRVLVVDDVVTTGSTISACAAPLKAAGAASVWGLALAR